MGLIMVGNESQDASSTGVVNVSKVGFQVPFLSGNSQCTGINSLDTLSSE